MQARADATVKEIRRKASKITPAYNKGALQYLPERKTAVAKRTLFVAGRFEL